MEFPDNGSEQEGRGGAWVARASDPLAAFYNPAGLAGQPTRLTLQANISTPEHVLHARARRATTSTQDGARPAPAAPTRKVCNDGSVFPEPAARLHLPPHRPHRPRHRAPRPERRRRRRTGRTSSTAARPSPQRYLLVAIERRCCSPRRSASAGRSIDNLRVGASLHRRARRRASTSSTSSPGADTPTARARRRVEQRRPRGAQGQGLLHPRLHARRHLEPRRRARHRRLVQVHGADRRHGRRHDRRPSTTSTRDRTRRKVIYGDTAAAPTATTRRSRPTRAAAATTRPSRSTLPMEAKLGVRYHKPALRRRRRTARTCATPSRRTCSTSRPTSPGRTTARSTTSRSASPATPTAPASCPAQPGARRRHPAAERRRRATTSRTSSACAWAATTTCCPTSSPSAPGLLRDARPPTRRTRTSISTRPTASASAVGGTYRMRLGAEKAHALDLMAGYGHVFFGTLSNNEPGGPRGSRRCRASSARPGGRPRRAGTA